MLFLPSGLIPNAPLISPWPLLSEELFSSLSRPARGKPLKLLSVLLQVAFYRVELISAKRAKCPLVIDKHNL